MDFFLDTAEVDVIKDLNETGLIDGITTNPSLVAKSGEDFFSVLEKITSIIKGPVSAEVTATETEGMINEGLKLSAISQNIVVKLPLTLDGLKCDSMFFFKPSTYCSKSRCYIYFSFYWKIG